MMVMLSAQSWGQDLCGGVFRERGLQLSVGSFLSVNQGDPKQTTALTLRLLQMTTATLGEAFSQKLTLEKGELVLGQNLEHGWSVEYEFFADRRTSKQVFRLGKISLIKPNGEKMVFDKKPTSLSGNELGKKWYSEEDMGLKDVNEVSPFDVLQTLEVPAVIQGELLNNFLKFAPMMEHLKREEINAAVNTSHLRTRGMVRSHLEYAREIIKKQSFKFIMIGIVMYIYYTEKDSLQKYLPLQVDPWAQVESKKQVVYPSGGDEVFQQVSGVIDVEKRHGGKARIYVVDSAGVKEIQPKKFMNNVKSMSDYGGKTLLVNLPVTQRVLTIESDKNSSIIVQGLSRVAQPQAYEATLSILQRHQAMKP